MITTHDISTYSDGYRLRIAFCKKCSREGLELLADCPGEIINETVDKKLDKKSEPS